MPARLTQKVWLERAKSIHKDKYDYSLVSYKNKSSKVIIICKIHGEFEQLAGNHLQGKGCPMCSPNAKLTQEDFIAKAEKKHGNKYLYDKLVFKNTASKVIIGCRIHGYFEQEANSHLRGSGCPACGSIVSGLSRSISISKAEKIRMTCIRKYGVSNVMQVKVIREKNHKSLFVNKGVTNPRFVLDYDTKYKKAMIDKYDGAEHYSKTQDFKDKYKDAMQKHYGVSNYAKSDEFQNRLESTLSKSRKTQIDRYGADHYAKSNAYRLKKDEYVRKNNEAKRKNGTFNTSNTENKLYDMLVERFGGNDVIRNYKSSLYPYMCDFYIKSKDLYIEYNGMWTHDYHWFGSDSDNDSSLVDKWKDKDTDFHRNAINTWTHRDVAKRESASKAKLNYVVFWLDDFSDVNLWFALDCPLGHDYDYEYSWIDTNKDLHIDHKSYKKMTPLSMSQIVKYYQQLVFYENEISMWNDNRFVRRGIRLQDYIYMNRYKYLNKLPNELTAKEIFRGFAISGLHRGFSVFDSSLMLSVINKYKPKSIFDPFAGWGERALAANLKGVDYVGVDINSSLRTGYDAMINELSLHHVNLITDSALSYKYSADMVLTCPPYFDVEHYTNIGLESQSYEQFLKDWKTIVDMNSNSKYFVFQINQKYKDDMAAIVENAGYTLIDSLTYNSKKASHLQYRSGLNKKQEFEEMLVFKK